MTTHCANTNTQSINRYRAALQSTPRILLVSPAPSILHGSVLRAAECQSRNQTASQRYSKPLWEILATELGLRYDLSLKLRRQDPYLVRYRGMNCSHLRSTPSCFELRRQKLLDRSWGDPLDQVFPNRPPRAINIKLTVQLPPIKSFMPLRLPVDNVTVAGSRILLHFLPFSKGHLSIPLPPLLPKRVDFFGVVTPLTGNDNIHFSQRLNIIRIFERGFRARELRCRLASLRGGKKVDSIREKSFSARIRSINTEPTMPRHPTKPTFFIANHL